MDLDHYHSKGWAKLPFDPDLIDWINYAKPQGMKAAKNPENHPMWLRSNGTWFVGVDALNNDIMGRVNGSAPLNGQVLQIAQQIMGSEAVNWDKGQVSICYRGYPKQDEQETTSAYQYRLNRNNAHLDGLKPIGPNRQRMMQEFHAFIMGIPLNQAPKAAAPFVIWEGSHHIFGHMLLQQFSNIPVDEWSKIDITGIYQKTRSRIFETCKPVEIHVKLGEAYVAHRFALHGMASWPDNLDGPSEGRMIAYFRPYWQNSLLKWLS